MAQAIADAIITIETAILCLLLLQSYRRVKNPFAGFFSLVCGAIALYRLAALIMVDYLKTPWFFWMHSHWVYDIVWIPTIAVLIFIFIAPPTRMRMEHPLVEERKKAS